MVPVDLSGLRAQVRAMDYVRDTADEVEEWREANAEARANLAIEGMALTIEDHAMLAQSARSCDFGQVEERTLNA